MDWRFPRPSSDKYASLHNGTVRGIWRRGGDPAVPFEPGGFEDRLGLVLQLRFFFKVRFGSNNGI
jgi:hypothetical protein